MIIKNCNALTEKACIENAIIEIKGEKISKIVTDATSFREDDEDVINANDYYVVPGFIDSHTHGAFGYDYSDLSFENFETILNRLPRFGTTAVVPTIGSTSIESLYRAISIVKNNIEKINSTGTKFLGFHLEGPFLNPNRKGSQAEQYLRNPDLDILREIVEFSEGLIRLVTIAPELENSFDLINYLVHKGIIVSVGHTEADYNTVINAFNAGAKRVTHLFNCMSSLHHRNPGPTGASLLQDDIYAEIVLDGFHIDPAVANIVYKIKGPEKIVLVTDSTHLVGLPEGEYSRPGGRPVIYKDGAVRMHHGILAGSVLTPDIAFSNAIAFLGISPLDAVKMSSTNVARSLGIEDIGVLQAGNRADIVIMDKDFQVEYTIINGIVEYKRGK